MQTGHMRIIRGVPHTFERVVGTPWWVRRTAASLSTCVAVNDADVASVQVNHEPYCPWCRLGIAHTTTAHYGATGGLVSR